MTVPLLTVLALALPLAVPGYVDREDAPVPTADAIERSVDTYATDGSVDAYTTQGSVESVAPPETDGGTTTLTVGSDVLFAYASHDLDPAAAAALAALVEQVPEGAQVAVVGHTDSRGGDAVNLPLSSARAEAVAAVLRSTRPDLVLAVGGAGSSEPVADEYVAGDPDFVAMARNRRVELRWAG